MKNDKSGFTIVEVLVAILVLAVGMAMFLSLLQSGINIEKQSQNVCQASLIAENIFSDLRCADLKNPPPHLMTGNMKYSAVPFVWTTDINWNAELPSTANIVCEVGWRGSADEKLRTQKFYTLIKQ